MSSDFLEFVGQNGSTKAAGFKTLPVVLPARVCVGRKVSSDWGNLAFIIATILTLGFALPNFLKIDYSQYHLNKMRLF